MKKQKIPEQNKNGYTDGHQLYLRLVELTEEFLLFASLHQDDTTSTIAHRLKTLAKEMNCQGQYP